MSAASPLVREKEFFLVRISFKFFIVTTFLNALKRRGDRRRRPHSTTQQKEYTKFFLFVKGGIFDFFSDVFL